LPEPPYSPKSSGRCPHCREIVCFDEPDVITYSVPGTQEYGQYPAYLRTGNDNTEISVYSSKCPNCKKTIVAAQIKEGENLSCRLVHPHNIVRSVSEDVPKEIREDFLEAAAVLPTSEKASAALSRRCLQNLLTDVGYKQKDLNDQIEQAIKDLPRRLGENLDAIRTIGNFAAHPIKYKSTGEIVDVESQEAEWDLDVLEGLFDYFYVQPRQEEEKRKRLDAKLKGAGKPPLKKA
jgi:hypothetical protein